MTLDWNKIFDECSKAYNAWHKWEKWVDDPFITCMYILENEDANPEENWQDGTYRRMYDFFDSMDLSIGVNMNRGGYVSMIVDAECKVLWADNHFPDRRSAEIKSFTKAFELLEDYLITREATMAALIEEV